MRLSRPPIQTAFLLIVAILFLGGSPGETPARVASAGNSVAAPGDSVAAPGDSVAAPKSRSWTFEKEKIGKAPRGFATTHTGEGLPGKWVIASDETAHEGPRVLLQGDGDLTSEYRFPLAIAEGVRLQNGVIRCNVKLLTGEVGLAAGIVYRYVDKDNYRVICLDAMRNSVTLYRVTKGRRKQIDARGVEVPIQKWHELEVRPEKHHVHFTVNRDFSFVAADTTDEVEGGVGFWTASDTRACFDDFEVIPRSTSAPEGAHGSAEGH